MEARCAHWWRMVELQSELDRCRPWIEAALEYSAGTHDFIDVCEGIYKGTMQLWPAPDGCLVSEIINYPKKRVLNIFLGGGELSQIMDMHADVINWAQQQECAALTMTGRFGWKKPLAEYGWTPLHASYQKEI